MVASYEIIPLDRGLSVGQGALGVGVNIGHTVNVEIFDASKFRTFCTRPTILKFRAHKFSSVILT